MSVLQAFLTTWARARDTFGSGQPQTGEHFDNSPQLRELQSTVLTAHPADYWSGMAAMAYGDRNTRHARVIGELALLDHRLGSTVNESAWVVNRGRRDLDEIRSWVLRIAQSVPPGPLREQTLMPTVQQGITMVGDLISASNSELNAVGAKIRSIAEEYAALGNGTSDERTPEASAPDGSRIIRAVDFPQSPPRVSEDATERAENESAAFRQVFGREPSSDIDWQTAATLDSHIYDPGTDGLSAEIRVARIDPVPGQGLVRVGQWIEQRDVISGPWKRDFGNGRTADPDFDPAHTKVTTYIDYDNGVVVMRQNPSVELNENGGPGAVRVGIPEAAVQQADDGAVRIRYEAANPFAPAIAQDPPWPLGDNPWTVNGDLVFTPTADGVRVDGTRTDYPSMEIYQDFSDGSTRTVLVDPAVAGNSTGPMVNLPRHHDIGVGGSAFAPFDNGGWNPEYDVRVPLPTTELGPTPSPPRVPPIPLPPGVIPV